MNSGLTWPVYSVARVAIASRRPGHSAAQLLAWSTCSSARVSPDTEGNIVKVTKRYAVFLVYVWFSQYLEKMPSSVFPIWNWDTSLQCAKIFIDRMTGTCLSELFREFSFATFIEHGLFWMWKWKLIKVFYLNPLLVRRGEPNRSE